MAVSCLLLLPQSARAGGDKALVLVDDVTLAHAIDVALEPWGLRVETLAASLPTDVGEALAPARQLAEAHGARALIWMGDKAEHAALYVYDAASTQILVRAPIAAPPYDTVSAAAIALSIKMLLRGSTLAPARETAHTTGGPPRALRNRIRLEAVIGGRALFGQPRAFELRLGAGIAWWPATLRQHLGVAIDFRAGPGVDVESAAFSGRFSDVALDLSARTRLTTGARLAFEPFVGTSVLFTNVSGRLLPSTTQAGADRVDPAVDGGIAMDVHLGQSIHLGVVATLSYLFRYQRYLVQGAPTVTLYPLQLEAALRLTAGVF